MEKHQDVWQLIFSRVRPDDPFNKTKINKHKILSLFVTLRLKNHLSDLKVKVN